MSFPNEGDLWQGKYVIAELLGRGGYAAVYRAVDRDLQRDVAIKFLAPQGSGEAQSASKRFVEEARVISRLQDPHTIRLFEYGEHDGLMFMVFQYVAGVDLTGVLASRGAFAARAAVHVTLQVLQALAEAHSIGVLHRDIKPANILIHEYRGDPYAAKLLDFGIAKVEPGGDNAPAKGLTRTGMVVGTPRYMAPEQIFGEPLTPAADLYSVGLVTYEMLVGEPAMAGDSRAVRNKQLSNEPIALPDNIAPAAVKQVIDKMLARDAAHRFQSAEQVITALRNAERAAAAPPTTDRSPPMASASASDIRAQPELMRRNVLIALLVGLVTAAIFAVGAVAFLPSHEQQPVPPTRRASSSLTARSVPPRPRDHPKEDLVDTGVKADAGQPARNGELTPAAALLAESPTRPPPPGLESVQSGCGVSHPWQRNYEVSTRYHDLPMRVYLPKKYRKSHKHALVLMLGERHHRLSSFVTRSGMDEIAWEDGDVIAVGLHPGVKYQQWMPIKHLDHIRTAMRTLRSTFCIDDERIYAVGHGYGARMAHSVVCDVGGVSGIVLSGWAEGTRGDVCNPNPAVPTLLIAGRKNTVYPMQGGRGCDGGRSDSLAKMTLRWQARNGCQSEGTTWREEDGLSCVRYQCDAAVLAQCLSDGGHLLEDDTYLSLLLHKCDDTPLKHKVGPLAWEFLRSL